MKETYLSASHKLNAQTHVQSAPYLHQLASETSQIDVSSAVQAIKKLLLSTIASVFDCICMHLANQGASQQMSALYFSHKVKHNNSFSPQGKILNLSCN